jgi:hypothetical protein
LGGVAYLKSNGSLWFWTAHGSAAEHGGTLSDQINAGPVQSFQVDGLGGVVYQSNGSLTFWTAHGSAAPYGANTELGSNGGTSLSIEANNVVSFASDSEGGIVYLKTDGSLSFWTAHGSAAPYGNDSQTILPIEANNVVSCTADGIGGIVYLKTDGSLSFWTAHGSAAPYGYDPASILSIDDNVQSFAADGLGGIVYLKTDGSLSFWTAHGSAAPYGGNSVTVIAIEPNSVQAFSTTGLGGVFYSKGAVLDFWTAHGSAAILTNGPVVNPVLLNIPASLSLSDTTLENSLGQINEVLDSSVQSYVLGTGSDGTTVYALETDGRLFAMSQFGSQYLDSGTHFQTILLGPDGTLYALQVSGGLDVAAPGGSLVSSDVNTQSLLQDANGTLYRLDNDGSLYVLQAGSTWTLAQSHVLSIAPILGGPAITVLTSDGSDWQFNGLVGTLVASPQFSFTVAGTVTAGQPIPVTLTILDYRDNPADPASGYTGMVQLSSSDATAGPLPGHTFTASDNGSFTFTTTFFTSGTQTITAKDSNGNSGSATLTVNPASATVFSIDPPPVLVGQSTPVTVTAYDSYGNIATGFSGMVNLTSPNSQLAATSYTFISNSQMGNTTNASNAITGLTNTANLSVGESVTGPRIPVGSTIASVVSISSITLSNTATASATSVTLTFGDQGTHIFSEAFGTTGGDKLVAFSGAGANETMGSGSVTVIPAAVDLFQSTVSVSPTTIEAGGTVAVVLTTRDAEGNQETSGGATVTFGTGTNTSGGNFGTVTDNGDGTYTVLFTVGTTPGSDTITASINGQAITSSAAGLIVTAGPPSLSQSTMQIAPATVQAGSTTTVALAIVDAYGNPEGNHLTVSFGLGSGSGSGIFGPVLYQGNGNYTATFTGSTAGTNTITASINGQTVTAVAPMVTVTPEPVTVRQAPGWSASTGASFTSILPQASSPAGNTVASVFGSFFQDANPNATVGIAVVGLSGTANGTWQYSTSDGTSWYNLSATISTKTALLLSSNDLLRFVPKSGFAGVVTLTALAWDAIPGGDGGTFNLSGSGSTGGTTAFSATTLAATYTVNNAPILKSNGPTLPTIVEKTTSTAVPVTSLLTSASYSDPDGKKLAQGVAVVGIATSSVGTWQFMLSGGIWQAVPTTVSLTSALLLPSTAALRFVSTNQMGSATLTYLGWDQTQGTAGKTFDIATQGGASAFSTTSATASITVRQSPSWSATSGATFSSILPGTSSPAGNTVASVFGGFFQDANPSTPVGIAVVGLTGTASGVWQYSTTNGTSWTNISATLSTKTALLLSSNDLLRFVPKSGFAGVVKLTALAWDGSSGSDGHPVNLSGTGSIGGTTAFSAATLSATCAVNTATSLSTTAVTLAAVNENVTSPTVTASILLTKAGWSDADGKTVPAGIAIVGDSGPGTWQFFNGATWTALPSTLSNTLALLLPSTGQLRFQPSNTLPATTNGTATLTFLAWDQTQGAAGKTFAISATGGATAFSTTAATASMAVNFVK